MAARRSVLTGVMPIRPSRARTRPPLQENAQMSAARAVQMADGHSAEAETAANEAAREARAEVIEQAEPPKRADAPAKKERTGAQKSAAKDATRAAKADPWHRFIVDVWLTNFNSVEFGFYKR